MLRPVAGLYVIVDPAACRGGDPVDTARHALQGGASILQWRDKLRDKGEQLADARKIAELCAVHGAMFIVNDHADLALACGADGVHLGQRDLPIDLVRPIVGASMIVGVSTNTVAEARVAQAEGADYVAVGDVFGTASKDATRRASLDRVREIRDAVEVHVVAIGGIDASNIEAVVQAGAHAAAVIRAVCSAENPRSAAAQLAAAFHP
jgi:thiamine-phosphate diphosphorylase